MNNSNKSYLTILSFLIAGIALFIFSDLVLAATTNKGLKEIAEGMSDQIKAVASLLIIVAYVSGVGFALAGVVQLKAHKDNPTQVPLSKPIVYLVVGACLLYLPTLISSSGQTIFGGDQKSAGEFTGTVGGGN